MTIRSLLCERGLGLLVKGHVSIAHVGLSGSNGGSRSRHVASTTPTAMG
jgi:hypothetical protein